MADGLVVVVCVTLVSNPSADERIETLQADILMNSSTQIVRELLFGDSCHVRGFMRLIVEVAEGLQVAEELDDIGGIEVMVVVPADAVLNVSPLAEDRQPLVVGDIFPTLSGEHLHDRSDKLLDSEADAGDGKAIVSEVGAEADEK